MAKSLSKLMKKEHFPKLDEETAEARMDKLQLEMLRIQQGIWHSKQRALILVEGFDAAGKGGTIRRISEKLDPRGVSVYPFGPPTAEEQGRHYLYRFWKALPLPGEICFFDRTWYGRVLVERVMKLTPRARWKEAYEEILATEKMLIDDGIDLVKIFLAITPAEQARRFKARIRDPYKLWKITPDDIKARQHWDAYVEAADEMLQKTDKKSRPWNVIPADDKPYARVSALECVIESLKHHELWLDEKILERKKKTKMDKALRKVKVED